MFDNLFLALAHKKNSYGKVDEFNAKIDNLLNKRIYEKATAKVYKNGNRLLDMDVVTAEKTKRNILYYAGVLGVAIVANKLGSRN